MIDFFLLSCIGYLLLAVVAILDKFILSKSLTTGTYTFYSTIFFFGAFVLLPFCMPVHGADMLWGLVSSLSFGLAAWPMYVAMKKGEATHVVPFIGAVTTLSVFVLSSVLLGEILSNAQMFGMVLLVLASIIFAHDHTRKAKGHESPLHNGYLWAGLSGVLFGLSHVTAKYFYGEYDFVTGLVWTKGFAGFIAFATLLSFATRRELKVLFAKKTKKAEDAQKNSLSLVVTDKVLAIAGTILIQYAISIGNVVVANALVGLQYALVLVFAYILTRVAPKIFREHFTKKEISYEIFAILLVVVGIVFLI